MGGCCASLDENTKYINSRLQEEEEKENTTHKLLFLGPGGSGKSTIFKQLQWLHGNGFSEKDAVLLKDHIYCQIISQMQAAIGHYLTADIDDEKLTESMKIVTDHKNVIVFDENISSSIKYIWNNDNRMKGIFSKHHKNKILDETTEYFWNDIDRISQINYIPSNQDIINVRYRTTGVIEKRFTINNVHFHIFDVGGQKSERKKWISVFDNVKAVVFVVSLSSYNELMFEDLTKNCMVDSLQLFDQIANTKQFCNTPVILFLNKIDLFKIKIRDISIKECDAFNDYDDETNDPNDYQQTSAYIKNQFLALNKQKRQIYIHLTCAMDNKNIENVFNDVASIILEQIRANISMM